MQSQGAVSYPFLGLPLSLSGFQKITPGFQIYLAVSQTESGAEGEQKKTIAEQSASECWLGYTSNVT